MGVMPDLYKANGAPDYGGASRAYFCGDGQFRYNGNQRQVIEVNDTNYSIQPDDDLIVITALTATRTLFLPPLASCAAYRPLTLIDEVGKASRFPIVIVPDGTDTINGIAGPIAFPSNNSGGTLHPAPSRGRWNVESINFTPNIRFQSFDINGKSVANTFLAAAYNVAGKPFFPKNVLFYVKNSTLLTVGPTISLGTNSPSYNNILAAGVLGATQANKMLIQPIADLQVDAVQPGEQMYLRVSVAALATAFTFDAYVEGFYN